MAPVTNWTDIQTDTGTERKLIRKKMYGKEHERNISRNGEVR